MPGMLREYDGGYLANDVALALNHCGERQEALAVWGAVLLSDLRRRDWGDVSLLLFSISRTLRRQNCPAKAEHAQLLSLNVAALIEHSERLFLARLERFSLLSTIGR